jgi:UDP-2,3-diacylglucosamine hydrolase
MAALDSAIAESDVFVLNGDVFDFRWSVLASEEETIHAALEWLGGLLGRHPGCAFHYVLGNHDCLQSFTEALTKFESTQPNLTCHPYYLRLGDTLFLHGDVAMRNMDAEGLEAYRSFWRYHKRKGPLMNWVWDAAFLLNLHRGIHRMAFPPQIAVKRVRHYIDSIGEGPGSGIRSVYFGHTHMALPGYAHGGIQFFNGGAALQGLEFNILRARVSL